MKGLFLRGKTWWFEQMRDGKRLRRSLKTSDEAEAIVKARELRFEVEHTPSGTFEQEIEAYIADRRAKRRISERYAGQLKIMLTAFARDVGELYPHAVTKQKADRWLASKQAHVGQVTLIYLNDLAHRFFAWLMAGGRNGINPFQPKRNLERKPVRKSFLGRKDTVRLVVNCRDLLLRYVILCALHAGLRKEEVIESRRSWFDLRRRTLHVKRSESWEPKDDEERVIPLTDTFVRFLKKFPKRGPDDYMLAPHKLAKGKWRYRYDFRRPFVAYMKAQGCESITFHDLRRSFASNLASSGESLYLIAKWLGDDPRVVARTYAHISPETRGKIDKLG